MIGKLMRLMEESWLMTTHETQPQEAVETALFHLDKFRPIQLLVCDPLFRFWLFPPFLSKVKASGLCQHWRHTRLCRKTLIKMSPPRPMCFWTWQSIRVSFVKTFWMRSGLLSLMTHGQGGPLLCLLLCWLSWEAIRVILVQPLGWLTDKADGPRHPGYLYTPKSYFKNVDRAGDLYITK